MKSAPGRGERQLHLLQSQPGSCQAACLAMALAQRVAGAAPREIEARLHGAHERKHPINTVGSNEPGVRYIPADGDDEMVQRFRAELNGGAMLIVHVLGSPWVARLPKGVTGPRGPLAVSGPSGGGIHSVLIASLAEQEFVVLDPWYSNDLQPLLVSDDELRQVVTGFRAVVVEPAAGPPRR